MTIFVCLICWASLLLKKKENLKMVETRIHPVVPDVAIIKRNKVKKKQ